MKITFIRHGSTPGNLRHRYIGRTDESLSDEGIRTLKCRTYPEAGYVIASPMKRCIETAKILYPGISPAVVTDLRECDFGDFEGKDHTELDGDPRYQQWIDSGGEMPFPGGESLCTFRERCCAAFINTIPDYPPYAAVSLVVHGGTIMSILSRFARPRQSYFAYQVPNGAGYETDWDGHALTIVSELI